MLIPNDGDHPLSMPHKDTNLAFKIQYIDPKSKGTIPHEYKIRVLGLLSPSKQYGVTL